MEKEFCTIAIDVMGGDNAPVCNIKGALNALKDNDDIRICLVGPKDLIRSTLQEYSYDEDRLLIVPASEVISLDESPVQALRTKKDATIVVGAELVKKREADAFISAGSSGAVLAAGQLIIGRMKGVLRPPLATMIPTEKGKTLFLDLGANVDAKAEWLVQFAKMGTAYMKAVEGIDEPTVKLINIGLEEEKGNALTKEVNQLLKTCADINYSGYAEAREVPYGTADIAVTDAFTGNAMLKMYEGTGGLLLKTVKQVLLTNWKTKLGALLIKNELKKAMKPYDISRYGGAPLLGIKGVLIKCHGNSNEAEISNAVTQAKSMIHNQVNERIANAVDLS